MKKILGVLCIVTAAAVLGGCAAAPVQAGSGKTSSAKAAYGDLLLGLSSDGKIKLPVTNLNFEVSGTITEVYVAAGDTVKKGDVLAELDDSDLRLALNTAQTNLDKANAQYQDTIANADYSLKSELASYDANKKKLETPFDPYTYEQSVTNAETQLTRKQKDLADAEAALAEAKAKQPAASVGLTIERRKADLAEAEAAVKQAEADLADARKGTGKTFDDYSYQNDIAAKQTALTRKYAERDEAGDAYDAAAQARDTSFYDAANPTAYEKLESAVASAEKTLETARRGVVDAEDALRLSKQNLERAKAQFVTDQADALDKNIETANKALENAKKSYETAKRSLQDAELSGDNAGTDLASGVKTAQKQVDSAKTAVEDAKASLESAKQSLERAKAQYEKDLETTRQNLETQLLKIQNLQGSSTSVTNALYAIDEAKLKLESATNDLQKIRITAPIDGQVLNVTAKAGETVSPRENIPGMVFGTSANSGLIALCDPTAVYLTASVTEGDIVGLSVGQPIRVTVDALGEENLGAQVYTISSIPSQDSSGIITYEVVGVMDEVNPELRDNMSAFLTFIKKEKLGVLLVPNKAVFMEDGLQYVNVQKEDGSYEKRQILGGLSNGSQTEVMEGLEAGETVVVGSVKS